jgi:hypothetical protein
MSANRSHPLAARRNGRPTDSPNRREVLQEKVDQIAEAAERSIASPHDRDRLAHRLMRVREALVAKPVAFVQTN